MLAPTRVGAGGTFTQEEADASVQGDSALQFAYAVGEAGDWDGDGLGDLWIEGGYADEGLPEAVGLYSGALLAAGGTRSWSEPTAAVTTTETIRRTARSAGVGDLDGDTCPDLVVPAYVEDAEGDDVASLYLLFGG